MDKFNLYIDKIDLNFWRELCTKEGKLRSYKKGEYFLHRGETTKCVWGFIKHGYFKYSVIDSEGNIHQKTIVCLNEKSVRYSTMQLRFFLE